jgi:hypothetical protein
MPAAIQLSPMMNSSPLSKPFFDCRSRQQRRFAAYYFTAISLIATLIDAIVTPLFILWGAFDY